MSNSFASRLSNHNTSWQTVKLLDAINTNCYITPFYNQTSRNPSVNPKTSKFFKNVKSLWSYWNKSLRRPRLRWERRILRAASITTVFNESSKHPDYSIVFRHFVQKLRHVLMDQGLKLRTKNFDTCNLEKLKTTIQKTHTQYYISSTVNSLANLSL